MWVKINMHKNQGSANLLHLRWTRNLSILHDKTFYINRKNLSNLNHLCNKHHLNYN